MADRTAYQKLQDFRADLERRAALLRGRENEIMTELAAQETGLDEAIIQGNHQTAQESINRLKEELASVQRERQALQNPPPGGILGGLIRVAWSEAVDEITVDLRSKWNAEITELEKAEAMFLAAVAELGEIKQRADRITSRITEAVMAIPGQKLAAPSLTTGIIMRQDRHEGAIFINVQESETAFKGGR